MNAYRGRDNAIRDIVERVGGEGHALAAATPVPSYECIVLKASRSKDSVRLKILLSASSANSAVSAFDV